MVGSLTQASAGGLDGAHSSEQGVQAGVLSSDVLLFKSVIRHLAPSLETVSEGEIKMEHREGHNH